MQSTFYFTKRKPKLGGGKLWFTFLTILLLILAFPSRGSADPAAADPEPYAVLSDNEEGGKTLTFYFGDKSEADEPIDFPAGEYDLPAWESNSDITTVVITKSFEDYYPTSCFVWFSGLSSLTSIEGLEYLKTSEVTVMIQMFDGCSSLQSLDLSKFDVENVEYSNYMFINCSSLRTIFVSKDWKLAEGASSDGMFDGCTNLYGGNGTAYDANHTNAEYARIDADGTPGYFTKEGATPFDPIVPYAVYSADNKTLYFYSAKESEKPENVMDFPAGEYDLPAWQSKSGITTVEITESFKDYYPKSCFGWFNGLSTLTSIKGLEYLKTSEVTVMIQMFSGCSSLQSIDLSKFDVENVKETQYMFTNCSSLRTIFVSKDWKLAEGASSNGMFSGCTNLYGGNGTAYDENHIDAEYAKIDSDGTPGYFTILNSATL